MVEKANLLSKKTELEETVEEEWKRPGIEPELSKFILGSKGELKI